MTTPFPPGRRWPSTPGPLLPFVVQHGLAVLGYGACGGLLIVALRLAEYRFLVLTHSIEIYVALIAALFAGLGIWLGVSLTPGSALPAAATPVHSAAVPARAVLTSAAEPPANPFAVDDAAIRRLGITPRELEILQLIATGMSNREIADTLFVSENTVKTHSSRLFDKLDVNRRMKAVQAGRAFGLIP